MSIGRLIRVVAVIVACGSLLTMSTQTARADPPEGIVRTFGILTSLTPDSDLLPYFFDEDSLAVVVAPKVQSVSGSLQFVDHPDPQTDPRVDGTTWVFEDATHVMTGPDGDSVTGAFLWLLTPDPVLGTPDPPPLGTFTFTGPHSPCIINQQVFYRRLCTGGDCGFNSGNDGKYVTTDPDFADDAFIVVTAVFSR